MRDPGLADALELVRPLAFIDLETTGLSTVEDRIVELALVRIDPDGSVRERVRRFNPEVPIPPGASAVHGITDEDVKEEAPFRLRARSLADLLDPCDLAGFNIRRFDLPMLTAEFRRAGIEFDPLARRIIDVQQIFHREEPRDLSAATRFYVDRELEQAHSALADVRASAEVLASQIARYPHLPSSVEGLHQYCDEVGAYETEIDRWFRKSDEGELVFRRGKHKGVPLAAVVALEPDYLHWMLGAEEMPIEVIRVVHDALAGPPDPAQADLPFPDEGSEAPGH